MKAAKQIFKEFSIPFIAALVWVYYNQSSQGISLSMAITHFGSAFFLISWGIGQVWRVKKQQNVESNFNKVEDRILKLTKDLEDKTNHLVNHITGEQDYYYYKIEKQTGPTTFEAKLVYHGDYQVRNNRIMFVPKNSSIENDELIFEELSFLHSYKANTKIILEVEENVFPVYSIIYSSSYKEWFQMINLKKDHNKLILHSKVTVSKLGVVKEDEYEIPYKSMNEW